MKVIDENLLESFRTAGPCEHCKTPCRIREPHHIFAKGMGAGGRLDIRCNLIALGSSASFECDCHALAHGGHIPQCTLLNLVAAREWCLQDHILECVWFFRRLGKNPTPAEVERQMRGMSLPARRMAGEVLGKVVLS